jgi:flavodoxin
MDEVVAFEINSPTNQYKLLIATQGSEFKNALTENIVNYYKKDRLYIKVIDVSQLNKTNTKNYNAILLIHTWENLKPPIEVERFIESNKEIDNKIIIYTTSGNGSYKMEHVDALTGESKMEDVEKVSNQIIQKLDAIL